MNVRACYGCPLRHAGNPLAPRTRKTRCVILQSKLDGVKGLGLESIDFKCSTKQALFIPGQQVTFLGRGEACNDYGRRSLDEFTGWVMDWSGRKVRVVSTETDKPLVKILPSRLKLTGEDTRRVCIHCGMPEGVKIDIKTQADENPRPWFCRPNVEAIMANVEEIPPLPCEYSEFVAAREENRKGKDTA